MCRSLFVRRRDVQTEICFVDGNEVADFPHIAFGEVVRIPSVWNGPDHRFRPLLELGLQVAQGMVGPVVSPDVQYVL